MPIENRDLPAGTKLVARYKGQQYVCLVEAAESGEGVVFALQGGKTHKSPSSAGVEVMGGKAVNGWRFWSVDGDVPTTPKAPASQTKAKTERARAPEKKRKVIYRNPNQRGLAEGKTRWFCTACMAGFVVETGTEPQACPEGHRNDDAELSSTPDPAAVAADKAEVEA